MHAESSIAKTAESEDLPEEVAEDSVLTDTRRQDGVESGTCWSTTVAWFEDSRIGCLTLLVGLAGSVSPIMPTKSTPVTFTTMSPSTITSPLTFTWLRMKDPRSDENSG